MDNIYSYKNDFREGVIFAFIKNNKILLEIIDNEKTDIFFPNGSIEEKDKLSNKNYVITALKREVFEEFDSKIELVKYNFISEVVVEDINVLFYVFLITSWKGVFPKYTVEDGNSFAELIWVNINDVPLFIPYDSGKDIIEKIKYYISSKAKLIDKKGVLDNEVFSYTVTKDKKIFIFWYNKQVKILSKDKARNFIDDIKSANKKEAQLIMAKITGNFKRGNEKNNKKQP